MSDENDEIEDGHIFTSGQHLWSPETKKTMASLNNIFADVPVRDAKADVAEMVAENSESEDVTKKGGKK